MVDIFIYVYVFVLAISVIALLKWNLTNLEKIKELEKSNEELIEASNILAKKIKNKL